MKRSILLASFLVAGIGFGQDVVQPEPEAVKPVEEAAVLPTPAKEVLKPVKEAAEPVKKKKEDPPPTIIRLDTGKEILRITHDGKIYNEGELVTRKSLTVATRQKAYERCAKMLLIQMEQN